MFPKFGHANGEVLKLTYEIAYDKAKELGMKTITATKARAALYRLLDEAAQSSEPIQITGKRNNGILLSEKDWRALQETLYLLSIPGMRESIRKGMKTPMDQCSEDPGW